MYSAILLTMLMTPADVSKTVIRERNTVVNSAGCQGAQAAAGCNGYEAGTYGVVFRRSEPLLPRRATFRVPAQRSYSVTRVKTQSTCPTCPNYVAPVQRVPPAMPRSAMEQTSPRVASIAARYLNGDQTVTVAEIRAVMASALTQAPDR